MFVSFVPDRLFEPVFHQYVQISIVSIAVAVEVVTILLSKNSREEPEIDKVDCAVVSQISR